MTKYRFLAFILLTLFWNFSCASASQLQLVSTESDPDAFILNSVNVINGDYCESSTDLVITGPDALLLQRFYSTKDIVNGTQAGGWRILPQRFLVIGKDFSDKSCIIRNERFESTSGFVGERSGGILPYSGWRNPSGVTKDPLKIDIFASAPGMVNTYSREINGQTNHQNNLLHCNGSTCELFLGDGTKRIYQKVQQLPSLVFGEELTPSMTAQVKEPDYYLLAQEILPSGNQLFFSYNAEGHLTSIEMKDKAQKKTFSWIHMKYDFQDTSCQVHVETSDAKTLTYHFKLIGKAYQLTNVSGSHLQPVSYDYQGVLVKKTVSEGRFTEISYQDGKVNSLKGPHPQTGKADVLYSFVYGNDYCDVFDAMGVKTRYIYDKRLQLTRIERYDNANKLYRVEQRYWGNTQSDAGLLLAKTVGDGTGNTHSYRSFLYDKSGNVIEERLYGNLTGKHKGPLQVSQDGKLLKSNEVECNVKTFGYSTDGFNLLTKIGDAKGNQTLYTYKAGTNLLVKKIIYEKEMIRKRTYCSYNDDGVRIKTIEDDGTEESEKFVYKGWCTERHVTEIKPKETLPGVGLPEMIEKRGIDLKKEQEVLIKRLSNTYDEQSNLLSCDTYDANGQYAFSESRTYNSLGQITSQTDASGRKVSYEYDVNGNQILVSYLDQNKFISTVYDFHDQPIEITEITADEQCTIRNSYDILGRKICSTDRFDNSTYYEYDPFCRLTKVIHPEVLDENNQLTRPAFSYTYDIFGNVTSIQDPKGFVTSKSYNLRGDPVKITYPDGSCERFKYDTEGSLHRSMTRDQIITVYEYDYLGRCIHEENHASNNNDTPTPLTDRYRKYNGFRCISESENAHAKNYYFDPAGRLSSCIQFADAAHEKQPSAQVTEIIYDPLGRIHQKKVWFDDGPQDFALECFEYDLAGNVLERRIEDSQGNILIRKGFSYNIQGQCVEEYSLENGVKTSLIQISYNSHGEPIAYLDPLGQETKIIIDSAFHNFLGQKVLKKTLVNPAGVQTEIEFDALSRVYSITKKDQMGVLLSSQKTLYDLVGKKSCEVNDRIVAGEITGSQKNRWIHGPMGRLDEEIEAADTKFEKRILYTYDTLGKMTSKSIHGTSTPITYKYNKSGKLHKVEAQNSNRDLQIANTYSYDRRGNIELAFTLQGNTVERIYNSFDQVIKETIKDGEGSYTLRYKYDRKSRLKEIKLPDNSMIAYTYDGVFGREVTRISTAGQVLYTHTYDRYNEQGKLFQETPIGYVGSTEYLYDLNGQKIAVKNDFFEQEYTRDPIGRLKETKGKNPSEYSYNDLSQLISEKKTTPITYAYDSLDNRIKVNDDELLYNSLNQLTSQSHAEFSYDQQGNLLRKVLDGEETRFENNLLSQLTSIENGDNTALNFSYDPFGRLLVEKHVDRLGKNKKTLSTSRFLYLGHQEIGSLNNSGAIETLKIPGLCGNELASTSIAFEINGETYVPFHDISGNVVGLVNPYSRQLIESYQYTAFGEETIYNAYGEAVESSIVGNPWRFAEKRVNQKSGLILFGLRFYDPVAGRWISQDPAGFIDGPNLYAYLHNNPLNHLDRFGLATEASSNNKFDDYFNGEVETPWACPSHRTSKRGGEIGKTAGSSLPKIAYDDDFEKHFKDYDSHDLFIKDYYDDSAYYVLSGDGLLDLPKDLGIGFTNGIWNDFKASRANAQHVSRLAGGYNIHAVYNATHGGDVDILESRIGLNYIATEPVRQLHKMWNNFFDRNSTTAKFLMVCHSQGAIHVRNALLDYPPELRNRILVVAIAPAGYIHRETCAQVIHYRAEWWRDFVPRLDSAGAKREADTIVSLDSHSNAATFDHGFMSPTYREVLIRILNNYFQSKGQNL